MKRKKWAVALTVCLFLQNLAPVLAQDPAAVETLEIGQAETEEQVQVNTAAPEVPPVSEADFDENGRCITIMPDPQGRSNSGLSWATGSYQQRQFVCGMTDESFFGVWDEATQTWTTQPKLNYQYFQEDYCNPLFSSLEQQYSEIEPAVKQANGDYTLAKELLLEYYRAKERILPTDKLDKSTKEDHLRAELYMDNYIVHANEKVLDIFEVGNEPTYWKSDVTDGIQTQINSGNYTITMLIAAVKKDGSQVAFQSVNAAENKPYLEMKINGNTEIIYPTDDTYLSAGSEVKTVHGKEDSLLIKNSGKGQFPPVDEQTAKTVLRFDFSNVFRGGDTFGNAVLNLYGSNIGTEGTAKLVIMSNGSTGWTEDTMDWTKYENYDFSYDGEYGPEWSQPPADAYPAGRFREELFRMSTWIDKLIGQYNVTGEEEYAFHAMRYIMHFIYNRRADWDSSLDMAVRGQYVPSYISQLLECEAMNAERFCAILKWMYGMADAEKNYATTNNWGIMESSGKYTIMLYYPELAPYQTWEQRVQSRMISLMNSGLKEDGSSLELSLGYADYWTEGVADFLDKAKHFQVDVILPDEVIDAAHQTTRYILDMMSPGGGDPQQADSYNYKSTFHAKQKVLDLADLTGDEELRWKYSEGKEGTEPDYTSAIYPIGKKVALRSNWTDQAVYMHFNADGGQGSHAHNDDLSIIVMAYGTYMLADPRYIQTTSLPGYYWLKSSKAHNLVEVNGVEQKTGTGSSLNASELNDAYDYVSMSTTNFNSPNKHTRSVLFLRPEFFIVNDYVEPGNPNQENTFNTYWHFEPAAQASFDEETKVIRTNFDGPNLQIVPTDKDMISWIGTKDGYYAGTGNAVEAKYMQTDAKKKGNISMTNVLYPNNVGEDLAVEAQPIELGLDGEGSASKIYITDNHLQQTEEYTYMIINNPAMQKEREVGDYHTDASLMVVEKNGEGTLQSAILQNGTHIEAVQSGELVYAKETVQDLSITWKPNSLELDTSKELDLSTITIYHSSGVQKVTLNGKSVPFQMQGRYVYFGDEPVIDSGEDRPQVTPTPSPTPKPEHGTSGGGGGGGSVSSATPTPTVAATPTATPSATPEPEQTPDGTSILTDEMKQQLQGHWAEQEIAYLIERGIVQGTQGDSLELERGVTRAEFAALIARVLKLPAPQKTQRYSDVPPDSWYADAIYAMAEQGFMQGDGTAMHPESPITREEMAKICAAICQKESIPAEESQAVFTDASQISEWAQEAVRQTVGAGLMQGMENGRFAPRDAVKREQAFVVAYRLLQMLER